MMAESTQLTSKALTLRRLTPGDAQSIYDHVNHKDIARWTLTIPWPYKKELAVKFIRSSQRQWRKGTHYTFGIIPQGLYRPVGIISLTRVDQKHRCAEVGYWLGKAYWNQGLTCAALSLILKFAFKELKLYRVYALTFAPNKASQRVLEKNGFVQEGVMRQAVTRYGKRHDFINYGLLLPEYRKSHTPRKKTKQQDSHEL